jgi:uncharacterized protein (DUF2235 family)
MVRNIVLCSDGTGSKGFQKRGTNVYKLFEAVDLHGHGVGPNSPKQIAFYDDGVGTETSKPKKILGSAFGLGLSKNVKQLYADLVRTYKRGDRIYLFGFSRGAFTVRTLAGLINTCGIIDRENLNSDAELLDKVEMAYSKYRSKYRTFIGKLFGKEYNEEWIVDFRNQHCVDDEQYADDEKIHIKFIGVWDTVDAVGAPIDEIAWVIDKVFYPFKFVDSKLSPENKVKKACHALSIDDERLTFHPVMWDEEDKKDSRIEQVWFAGVHSNVGGGYPKHGMSLVSLYWMMSKAEQSGLRFIKQDRELYRHRRNVTDKLYDSRSGMAVYYRYKPRDIGGEFCKEYHIITPKIHNSVIERIKQRTEGYAPGNIPFDCEFVSTKENYENYENYDVFIQVFRNHHTGEKSLLDRFKRWVLIRRKFHSAFLISSIIALCTFMYIEIPELGFFGTIGKLFTITGLIQIATNLLAKPILSIIAVVIPVIITIVLLVIVWILRKKISRDFSAFWYAILKEVDKIKKDSE